MYRIAPVLLLFLLVSCKAAGVAKINGVSFVASGEAVSQAHVDPVLGIYAGHAAVMPYGFIREPESPEIIFNTDRQMYGETRAGAGQYIELLHRNGIEVMLKPQLWIWRGLFTGELTMKSEEDWIRLETAYTDFILTYATLAEETHAELFCIGTELETFVKSRPEYWHGLIRQVRERYSGQITYASNWDEYEQVPFWEELDFIGIDAYFPLSGEREPSVAALREGWMPWKEGIRELSLRLDRPVLFTEYGYRSMDFTAKKPWLVDRNEERVNLQAQSNAKKALFEEFWSEPWFAGGFLWKWFINYPLSGGPLDNRFTPQNKPAERVIREYYRRNR